MRPSDARCAAVLVVPALVLALSAAPARAASVRVDGSTLRYVAGPREVNLVQVEDGLLGDLAVTESGYMEGDPGTSVTVEAGPGCVAFGAEITCDAPPGGFEAVMVDVGDAGSNRAEVEVDLQAALTGGPGDDELRGAGAADALDGAGGDDVLRGGGGGDELTGGAGVDGLEGGDGQDRLAAARDGAADAVDCGEGDADAATVDEAEAAASVDCEAVEIVPEPAPEPEPTPAPAPAPAPEPEPGGGPPPPEAFPVAAPPSSAPPPPGAARLPPLEPRPVVRFAGTLTRNGARIRLLTVRAPAGSRVMTRCIGRKCPYRRRVVVVGGGRTDGAVKIGLERLQRSYRAGTVLEIAVTKRNHTGKFTRILIRRAKAPKRTDACLRHHGRHPFPCPS